MVAATRLDCILGSASTMRAALVRAVHHARHRSAFGALLVDQPLMQNVLADLALEVEAATTLALRLAHAVDEGDTALSRLGVAVGKYWVCKRTSPMVAEALECLGGNGYVEENGLARLYREAPLNSIWEGSGNVNALDVLRAITREPLSVEAFRKELAAGARPQRRPRRRHRPRRRRRRGMPRSPVRRPAPVSVVEHLAVTLQASLLARHAPTRGGRRVRRQPARRAARRDLRHARRRTCRRGPRPHDRRPARSAGRPGQPLVGVAVSPRSRTGRCRRGR